MIFPLAAVPTSFAEWLWYSLFVAAGGLVYLLGNIILGRQQAGGKRLVLFFAGSVFGLIGAVAFLFAFGPPFPFPEILMALTVGGGSTILALLCYAVSLFGSLELIEKLFKAILRGV